MDELLLSLGELGKKEKAPTTPELKGGALISAEWNGRKRKEKLSALLSKKRATEEALFPSDIERKTKKEHRSAKKKRRRLILSPFLREIKEGRPPREKTHGTPSTIIT